MSALDIPIDDPTDEAIPDGAVSKRRRKMPGQRSDYNRNTGEALAVAARIAAPEGAPRGIEDLPLGRCICKVLPAWARPCSPCKWSVK